MTVPTYDKFIEPVLRYLATKPEGAAARDVHEAAADALGLDDSQRAKVITSGQLVYKNRAGWAHDRLKRAGLSQSLSRGKWCLTPAGFDWVASHPQPMTEQETNHLAFDFVNVKLKSRPDAVDLDPKADSPDHEELAKSSPDDRLNQALKSFVMRWLMRFWKTYCRFLLRALKSLFWMFCIARGMAATVMICSVLAVLEMVASMV